MMSDDQQDQLNSPTEKEPQIRSGGTKTTIFGTVFGAAAAVPT
jgi:hypothetical protein